MTSSNTPANGGAPLAQPLSSFAKRLTAWQREHGRHDLPWQRTRDPYRIWLSEIMLQQTQVATVIAYYERFLARFPTLQALADAPIDEVMRVWSGLGYYSRARNLHRAAQIIVAEHGGRFPTTCAGIEALPGIGRSTAAAIASFAFGERAAILDGNVKRVLARYFAIEGFPGERRVEEALWSLAESLLPAVDIEAYTQGLMDLGATLCTTKRPRCFVCPLAETCQARATDRVDVLPAPRPRRTVPHRQTGMLVLIDGSEVLLERRPPSGIWGGLWCFPEIEDAKNEEQVLMMCRERFGCEAERIEHLPIVKHGFTHFSLDIVPLVVRIRPHSMRACEPGITWLALDDARQAALPVPAKKILDLLASGQAALFEESLEHL